MHVQIKNQENGHVTTLCIDRDTHHCEVIQADPEDTHLVAGIAKATGAESMYVIVPAERIKSWEAEGWRRTNFEVLAIPLK